MKTYVTPDLQIAYLEPEDVVRTSPVIDTLADFDDKGSWGTTNW